MTRHQKEDLANKYFNLYRRNYIHFGIITIIVNKINSDSSKELKDAL